MELAREWGLPARALSDDMRRALDAAGVAHADVCVTRFYGETLSVPHFLSLVDAAFAALGGDGTVEIMCHPGLCDATLSAISTYDFGREEELRVFTASQLPDLLVQHGVTVIDAASLAP